MDNICTNAVQEVLIVGNNQQCLLPVLKVAETRNKLIEDDPFVQELIMYIKNNNFFHPLKREVALDDAEK